MTPRPNVTNRGRWLARHTRLRHLDRPCEPGCPICDELANRRADYSTPPPSSLAGPLR